MPPTDSFQRFYFEHLGIRGEIVRLEEAWLAIQGASHYPPSVAAPLGEAMAAVVLLSGTIKFEGSLILQV
ncbi:MAG: redox-regulated molecular chaperone Hsp33, partial [Methylococcus sp.]